MIQEGRREGMTWDKKNFNFGEGAVLWESRFSGIGKCADCRMAKASQHSETEGTQTPSRQLPHLAYGEIGLQ